MSDTARLTYLHSPEDKYGLRINEAARHFDFVRALEEVRCKESKGRTLPWQVHLSLFLLVHSRSQVWNDMLMPIIGLFSRTITTTYPPHVPQI